MNETQIEYRYEQYMGSYVLKGWRDGREEYHRGEVAGQPIWLRDVLHVAKVAGHVKKVKHPPPTFILWFRTDAKGNLIEFIELDSNEFRHANG